MAKTSLGIAQFIPRYPDRKDKNLAYELARKKEFYDLRLGPSIEADHIPGTPYKHQLLNSRLISPYTDYKSVLVFYDPGLGKCVLPQTTVLTDRGSYPIEELWDKYSRVIIHGEDGGKWSKPCGRLNALCYNEKAGKVISAPVNRLYRQHIDEDIVHIELDDGSNVSITKAHHLYDGEKWTNNFSEGMRICVPSKYPDMFQKEELDPDFAHLLAWQISGGREEKETGALKITQKNEDVLERIKTRALDFFRKENIVGNPIICPGANDRCSEIRINSVAYRRYLEGRGYVWGSLSKDKVIPNFILAASDEHVKLFLRDYLDAGGTVADGYVAVSSASHDIIHKLSIMLRRFGLWLRIRKKWRGAADGKNIKRLYYEGSLTEQDSLLFGKIIGFGEERKQAKIAKSVSSANIRAAPCQDILSEIETEARARSQPRREKYLEGKTKQLTFIRGGQLNYPKIKSIRAEHYSGWVYDLEILHHHNYIANNIICHNTSLGCYIVEQFKNVRVDGKPRGPAVILVPNEAIEKVWRNEIVNVCTQNIYDPVFTEDEEKTEGKLKGRTKKMVKKTYTIDTHDKFIKSLPKNPEQIRREYSNRIIIIDEAHSLRIDEKKKENNQKRYDRYYRFLHSVDNCRIILLTATPIWDKTYEIASLMNLIIPEADKLPVEKEFMKTYFTDEGRLKTGRTLSRLKRLFRGRISYLRIKLPVEVKEMGTAKPWLNYIKVYPDAMSETQASVSKKARANVVVRETQIKRDGKVVNFQFDWDSNEFVRDEDGKLIPDSGGKPFSIIHKIEGGALIRSARQACIMVAPVFDKMNKVKDVTFAEDYFFSYFKEKRPKYSFKNTPRDAALKKLFTQNLYTYSAKYASIIQMLKQSPAENVFIYNRFVKEIGGILPFAMILALHGFVWATSPGEIKHARKDVRRFIVITSLTETSSDDTEKLVKNFNHPDNMRGDRCQIVIGSQKMAVGLTLKNIRQIHFISPWWNIPSMIQAFGRGYRIGSHAALPENERYINLYRHAAVYEAEGEKDGVRLEEGFPEDASFSPKDTIDIDMYRISQKKEFSNSEIYRFMKEMAWDCPLSYNRNVLTTDEDFSRQCDYRECEYDCYGVPTFDFRDEIAKMSAKQLKRAGRECGIKTEDKEPDELRDEIARAWKYRIPEDKIERDTNDLYYSARKIVGLIAEVIKQFGLYFTLSLESLMRFIPVEEEEKASLLQALDHIIDARILIRDSHGFDNYLREYNNVYFLSANTSAASAYPEANYTSNPLVTERVSLGDVVKGMHFEEDEKLVEKFCKRPIKYAKLLDEMRCRTFIILLEATYVLKREEEKGKSLTKREAEVLAVMKDRMNEMLKVISDEGGSEEDVVHVLYQADIEKPKCNIANKALRADGSMRIYDEDLNKWKFLENRDKEEEYINHIKIEKKETMLDVFDGNPYDMFGCMKTGRKGDRQFAIRRKPPPPQEGRVCSTIPKPELIKTFFDLGYFPKGGSKDKRKVCLTRIRNSPMHSKLADKGVDLSDKALEKFSDEKIQGIDWLMHKGKIKEELCPLLQKWFQTHTDDNGNSLFKEDCSG